jgi:hypothetical protein
VAVACLALIVPGAWSHVPAQSAVVQAGARFGAALAAWPLPALWRNHLWPVVLVAVAVGLGLSIALLLYTRRGGTSGQVRRLSQRGLAVPAIARRTGLAQDAIRDLLAAESAAPMMSSIDLRPAGRATLRTQEAR